MPRDWMTPQDRRDAAAEEKSTRFEAWSMALLLLICVVIAIRNAFF